MAKKKGTGNNGQLSLFGAANTTLQLNNQLADIERKITALYGSTYKYAAQLEQVRAAVNSGQEFTWQDNPAAAKAIEQRLNAVAATLDSQLSKATEKSFALGQASTEHALAQAFGKDKATQKEVADINADAAAEMRRRGADGHTYYTEKRGGVSISDRVWNITESTKLEIEVAIQVAALEGKGADDLARTIQQYLEHPERLFRAVRVKDPVTGEWTGEFRLSKAAQQCHPGQGVYRSAYKNALRLARTELTQAYRRAEWETYQDNPLITGYRIELSNNHTTTVVTKKGREIVPLRDICDDMAGTQFPKTFLWTGWHPQCRCRMIPVTISKDDFKERVKARHLGKLNEWKPKEQTTEMPEAFTKWVEENKQRWQQPGHAAPYFIRDNYQQGDVAKGLDPRIVAELQQAQMAAQAIKAKEPPTPQPITDYDTEVMELRSIADKYGLDLTRIEQLRAEGTDKKALRTAINMQQKLWHKREGNWKTAYEDARAQIMGLMGLLSKYRSQENTRDFWRLRDEIIPNYNMEVESYDPAYGGFYNDAIKELKALKKTLEKLYYQYEGIFKTNIPSAIPLELQEGGKYIKEGEPLDNEFFQLLDPKKPIKFKLKQSKQGSYSEYNGSGVTIDPRRGELSPWQRRSVIYHEYGHCIDAQRKLWEDQELLNMRANHKRSLIKEKYYYTDKHVWDAGEGRMVWKTGTERISRAEYIDRKLVRLQSRILKMSDSVFKKRGITKDDVIEQIGSTRDTIMSLVISCGHGHSREYFSRPRMKETEYLAHAFENTFIGNQIFKKYLPDIYAEMIAYIKSLPKMQ